MKILSAVFLISSLATLNAQNLVVLDLGDNLQLPQIAIPAKKNLKIQIQNLLPGADYVVTATLISDTLPPFTLDTTQHAAAFKRCDAAVQTALLALNKVTSEKEFKLGRAALEEALKCPASDITPVFRARAEAFLRRSSKTFSISDFSGIASGLRHGQSLILKIERAADKGKGIEAKTWTFTLFTEKAGAWQTSYGFTMTASLLFKRDEYFLQQDSTGGTITPKRSVKRLDLLPSVFFTYYPNRKWDRSSFVGISAGFGTDLNEVALFGGATWVFRHNFLVSGGLGVKRVSVLRGEYSSGQHLGMGITADQIHELVYRPDIFLACTYRFGGKNPFAKQKDAKEADEQD